MILEHFELRQITGLADFEALKGPFNDYRAFYGLVDTEQAAGFLKARMEAGDTLILAAESTTTGALVGFAQVYYSFSSLRLAPFWVLNDLFVEEAYRGQGVGEQLLAELKTRAEAQGVCGIMLDTAMDNARAQSLYRKMGFLANEASSYMYWFSKSE